MKQTPPMMQKYQLLVLCFCMTNFIYAQEFYEAFRFSETINCPFDPGSQVEWPEGWSVYHTKNNLWDGEVDSTWCISVELVISGFNRRMYINAEEIDGERPVFIRYMNFASSPVALPPDMLYTLETNVRMENNASLIIGKTSPPLSGVLLSVDIPAEDSISRDERIRFYEFQDSTDWVSSSNCFASEKFIDQRLKELVIALSIRHTKTKGHLVELNSSYMQGVYYFDILAQHTVGEQWWQDTSYIVPIQALGSSSYYYENYMLPYTSPAYPSSAHISYYDLAPENIVDTAQVITVIVEEYMTLTPQLFTALRGDLVTAGDSIRHYVELVNNGGTFCLQSAEINFEEDTKYVHRSGTIDMRSDLSCMMFKSGATFELAEHARLDYGHGGMGFLAMKQGSQLILKEDAEMQIHNTLVIQKSPAWDHTHPTVYLYPGSKLSFAEAANLQSWESDLKLRVMMMGGELEVTKLSAEERNLIELVYPPFLSDTDDNTLVVIKDETNGKLRLYLNAEHQFTGTAFISDVMGHILYKESIDVYPGNFYHPVDLSDLSSGWFVIAIQTPSGRLATTFTHHE